MHQSPLPLPSAVQFAWHVSRLDSEPKGTRRSLLSTSQGKGPGGGERTRARGPLSRTAGRADQLRTVLEQELSGGDLQRGVPCRALRKGMARVTAEWGRSSESLPAGEPTGTVPSADSTWGFPCSLLSSEPVSEGSLCGSGFEAASSGRTLVPPGLQMEHLLGRWQVSSLPPRAHHRVSFPG